MTKIALLDSSVLVGAFRKEDPHFLEAKKMLNTYDVFVIPEYILVETLTVLKMREGKERAKMCNEFLQNNQQCVFRSTTNTELQQTLEKFFQTKTLSFIDHLIALISLHENIPLLTFDLELRKYCAEKKKK